MSLVLLLFLMAACSLPSSHEPSNTMPAKVTHVVDGDTVDVRVNGRSDTVRMLLIDTPETVHPQKPVEPFGPQAHQFAENLLAHQTIQLEFDGPKRGKYNRLLAYVWINGQNFGKMLLENGLARYAYVYDPPYTHAKAYRQAQKTAKQKKIGIWSIPGYVTKKGYNIEY